MGSGCSSESAAQAEAPAPPKQSKPPPATYEQPASVDVTPAKRVEEPVEALTDGEVFTPRGPLQVKAYIGDALVPGFAFPELGGDPALLNLSSKPNIGFCFSGGGMRAASICLGQLRGLHELGLLKQARYVSGTSGSAWVLTPMSYQTKYTTKKFLGRTLSPSECTLEAVAAMQPGSFDHTLGHCDFASSWLGEAVSNLGEAVIESFFQKDLVKDVFPWGQACGQAFLAPYGLDNAKSIYTAAGPPGGRYEQVAAVARDRGMEIYVSCRDPILPFPIVNGSVYISDDPQVLFPYEFTPLYNGCPSRSATGEFKLGGGFIEPLGYNAKPSQGQEACVQKPGAVELEVNVEAVVSLKEMMGVSSLNPAVSAVTGAAKVAGKDSTGIIMLANGAVGGASHMLFSLQDLQHSLSLMVDGGNFENSGILPLLRRKVAKCVSFISPARSYTKLEDMSNEQPYGLLFGVGPDEGLYKDMANMPYALAKKVLHVFPSEEYTKMFDGCMANLESTGVAWHRATYPVLENAYCGVPGGWEVEVLWVVLTALPRFVEALPEETCSKIAEDTADKGGFFDVIKGSFMGGTLKNFPNIPTNVLKYTPELAGLMGQAGAWMVHSDGVRQAIEEMVTAAES